MTLLNLEHVFQQTVLVMFIIVLELAPTVIVESYSFATVHINILLVTCLGLSVSVLIRLLREERAKLSSLSSLCHAWSFSSEITDASLRMMRDRTLRTSTRNTSLPTCRFTANYFDVVNLFGYF